MFQFRGLRYGLIRFAAESVGRNLLDYSAKAFWGIHGYISRTLAYASRCDATKIVEIVVHPPVGANLSVFPPPNHRPLRLELRVRGTWKQRARLSEAGNDLFPQRVGYFVRKSLRHADRDATLDFRTA